MLYDIAMIICCMRSDEPLEETIRPFVHLFNEQEMSHQFILVCNAGDSDSWEEILQLARKYTSVTAYAILHRNQFESMSLCGVMHAQSKILVTMDNSGRVTPKAVLAMYAALTQSNCDLLYGRILADRSPLRRLWSRFRRLSFSLLSGLSSEISSFRMIKAQSLRQLKIRTPWQFSFDQQLHGQINNHSYLYFTGSSAQSALWPIPAWKRWLILPFAWTYLGESTVVILMILNLILLLRGALVPALILGILALLLIWVLYMTKWRRAIAYKIVHKLVR